MTQAEKIHTRVNELMDDGMSRPDAFKKVAGEFNVQVNSARGSYYSFSRGATGKSRPRRRETTPEDALADARASLERSIEAIDREVATAAEYAATAAAEAEALRDSADARKQVIADRLEGLK